MTRLTVGSTSFCIVLVLSVVAWAQPSATIVLDNVRAHFEKVNDYSADISVKANIPRVKVPLMNAKMYFKKPDKYHIDSEGFALLPRDVVAFNPGLLVEDYYDAVVQGTEDVNGTACIKVKLLAKADTMRLQRLMLYVDQDRWLIQKMSTDPNRGGSADVTFSYTLVDGKYWMPKTIKVEMAAPKVQRFRKPGQQDENEDTRAEALIAYSNYRINKGLSDSIFKEKQ